MCSSQASSGWPSKASSQPSDLRPPAPSTQGSGRSREDSPGFTYRTVSAHKQLWAGAPWEPLPSWVIKCTFYLVNCFPLTSTSTWPAASTSFPLLTGNPRDSGPVSPGPALLSACPRAVKLFALHATHFHLQKPPLAHICPAIRGSTAPKDRGREKLLARCSYTRNCLLSQGTLDLPTWW